ncbi:AlpA family phage regulatory protein [Mesorhizobium sp. M0036]|uniref:helix-turn-helix transcriptional regulator n=1 Tax=Mesorhizobium sp. M0036 TaxID=2956853 RepID=UPI003335F0CA
MSQRLLSMKQVLERIPLSKTEIYRRIRAGTFPIPIRLGPARIAFSADEIDAWILSRSASGQGRA